MVSCKKHPENAQQTIIAYAYPIIVQDEPSDYQLNFLVWDSRIQALVNFYKVKNILISDAVVLESITLDTAPYTVSSNNRLIGLRLNYEGSSRANPYSLIALNLYDLKRKSQLLNNLVVKAYQSETDTRCNAEVKESHNRLLVTKIRTNQYADLLVKGLVEYYELNGDMDHCEEVRRQKTHLSFTLKFNGKEYEFPPKFKEDYQY